MLRFLSLALLTCLAGAVSAANVTNVTNSTNSTVPPPPPTSKPRYVFRRNGTRFTLTSTPKVARHITETDSPSPSFQQSRSLSDSLTSSRTPRFSGGYLSWDRSPGVFDLSFQLTYLADLLTTQDITVELQLLSDKFDVAWLRSNPAQAFKLSNFSLLKPSFLQARGIIGQSKAGKVLTQASLAWFNTSVVRITFFKDDFVQLSTDETIGITFLANATMSKIAPKNVAQLTFTATKYSRDVGLFSALGAISAVSAAMTIATGMPGTHQLQAVAMIGSMTCVDASVQAFTEGGEYFLLPVSLDPSTAGQLASIVIIAAYVAAAHIVCCRIICSKVARMTLQEAMSRTHFPSIPYGLIVILFPGFIYFLGQFFYEVIDGGLTVLVYSIAGLAAVFLAVLVRMMIVSPSFLDRRFAFDAVRSTTLCGLFTRPVGRWNPPDILRMYRTAIAPVAAHSDKFMLIIFIESGVTAGVTSYQSYSQGACNAQFAILAFFNIGCGFLYVARAPYRYFFDNVASTLMNAALLVMTLTNAVTGNGDTLIAAYKAAIVVAVVLGATRCGLALLVLIREECFEEADEEPRSPRVRLPDSNTEVTVVPPRGLRRRIEEEDVSAIPQVESEGDSNDDTARPAARRGASPTSPSRGPASLPASRNLKQLPNANNTPRSPALPLASKTAKSSKTPVKAPLKAPAKDPSTSPRSPPASPGGKKTKTPAAKPARKGPPQADVGQVTSRGPAPAATSPKVKRRPPPPRE